MKLHSYLPIISIFVILCGACREDVAWSDAKEIDPQGWRPGECIEFNLDPIAYQNPYSDKFEEQAAKAIGDTVSRLHGTFNASVGLRYSSHCDATELKIIMERSSLRSEISTDTLTFPLFSPEGEPIGKGRFGVYESTLTLPRPLTVDEGTILSFTPIDYASDIKGCMGISLILSKQ